MTAETITTPSATAIHPAWVRICHWINALAILMMIGSGWQIYDASPLFDFAFPRSIALGNWLGGALLWHFAAMWLLVVNGIVYVTLGFATGRFRRKLLPIYPSDVVADAKAALTFKLSHDDLSHYNAIQKLLYAGVILTGVSDRSIGPVDLEAGAVSGIDRVVRRLRHRALCAFLRDGNDRCLSGHAYRAGADRAEKHPRHGCREITA